MQFREQNKTVERLEELMKKFSKIQIKIIMERLWRNIDRIFSQDTRSFVESMSPSDKVNYFLCKRQLLTTVVMWWMHEKLNPLMFEPEKAIYRTKEQVYCGLVEGVDKSKKYKHDLLEYALLNMLVVPNVMVLTEDCSIKNRFNRSKENIKLVRAAIKDCVENAIKYSDMEK